MSGMAGIEDQRTARAAVKLTYDDFVHFPDDGKRHELIDGEHYVTPSPNIRHQGILGSLYLLIANWLEEHPIGRVFVAPLDVVLSSFDVVEPDLLYLSNERAAQVITPLHVRGVPELVVEIASKETRKRDETIKRRSVRARGEYLSTGSSIPPSTWCASTRGRGIDSAGRRNSLARRRMCSRPLCFRVWSCRWRGFSESNELAAAVARQPASIPVYSSCGSASPIDPPRTASAISSNGVGSPLTMITRAPASWAAGTAPAMG